LGVLGEVFRLPVEGARREGLVDRDVDAADPSAVHPGVSDEIAARIDDGDIAQRADLPRLGFRDVNEAFSFRKRYGLMI